MRNSIIGSTIVIGLILVVFAGLISTLGCQIFHAPCPDSLKNPPIIPDSILLPIAIIGMTCMIIGCIVPIKNHFNDTKTVSK